MRLGKIIQKREEGIEIKHTPRENKQNISKKKKNTIRKTHPTSEHDLKINIESDVNRNGEVGGSKGPFLHTMIKK